LIGSSDLNEFFFWQDSWSNEDHLHHFFQTFSA